MRLKLGSPVSCMYVAFFVSLEEHGCLIAERINGRGLQSRRALFARLLAYELGFIRIISIPIDVNVVL